MSDVDRSARADTELVALRVGHRNPVRVVALPDVDTAGTQRLQATDLRRGFGPFTIAGAPHPSGHVPEASAPRRPVIDTLLVEAAARDGVEVRTGFTVEEIRLGHGNGVTVRGEVRGEGA
jgi:hypothetical protein